MIRQVIFHLNILADPILLRRHYQHGLAQIMQARYGKTELFWADIQEQIFEDWASYHADLNYSGDDSMDDMREGRFRVTRALFRLANIPEPPKSEISQLAEDLISQAPKYGDAFPQFAKELLTSLDEKHIRSSIVSYYPEKQLNAILDGGGLRKFVNFAIGADTFEHYEMDKRYFEYLLNKLQVMAEYCLYVDNRKAVIASAEQVGLKILNISTYEASDLPNLIAKIS